VSRLPVEMGSGQFREDGRQSGNDAVSKSAGPIYPRVVSVWRAITKWVNVSAQPRDV
jgi:hypothetical protein